MNKLHKKDVTYIAGRSEQNKQQQLHRFVAEKNWEDITMKSNLYGELHALKSHPDVRKFIELTEKINSADDINSVPVYKMGFSQEFVKKARKAGYFLYGELSAVSVEQLENDLGKDCAGEYVLREKLLTSSSIPAGAKFTAIA